MKSALLALTFDMLCVAASLHFEVCVPGNVSVDVRMHMTTVI